MLVVLRFRRGDHIIPGLWEIHSDGDVIQGRLVGVCVHDTAVHTDGLRTCYSALRNQQYDHSRTYRSRNLSPIHWEQISAVLADLLCGDVSCGLSSLGTDSSDELEQKLTRK